MNAVVSVLLLAAVTAPTINHQPEDWRFQGRVSVAERLKQRAVRCGLRSARLEVVRGAPSFHNPEEAGAELTIAAAEMTNAAKACIAPALAPQPQTAHYNAITSADAAILIAKLKNAQIRIKAGENLTFELVAGAPAFYPATEVAPRRSFLAMDFGRPYAVEQLPSTGLWQHYELTYFPPGPDTLMWKVNVTTGQLAELVRVEMLYKAPPPF
ncbi:MULTISPECIES: hypothetical protein [unclassified Sphingomonas]|uniref:hypothetical protein n=1 Tax=unclassified Sphingomonas TaxID=196159 RepID=UPI00226A4DB2|nr:MULTISPECIES: hypothetical protein [unclassified Sphingomonas]